MEPIAVRIVNMIVADLRDRRGLGQEWDQINPDIRESIRIEWHDLINRAFLDRHDGLRSCQCGGAPIIGCLDKWPAQYVVVCPDCGTAHKGPYYASDDEQYRHAAVLRGAIEYWNNCHKA